MLSNEHPYADGEPMPCWNCGGEGVRGHDCGEDCCACLYPEENVPCDICDGRGGWLTKEGGSDEK